MSISVVDPRPARLPGIHSVYAVDDVAAALMSAVGYVTYETPTEPSPTMLADACVTIATEVDALALVGDLDADPFTEAVVAVARATGLPILDAVTGQVITSSTPLAVIDSPAETALDASVRRHPAGSALTPGEEPLSIEETPKRPDLAVVGVARSAGGEIRTVSATGGEKGAKEARHSLIPAGPLKELAVLFGRGTVKYAPNNWKKGYDWSLSYDALKRHLDLWWSREEDHDAEMGVKHLVCVIWHAIVLCWFMENRPQFDDRPHGVEADGETYVGALPTPQWILDKQTAQAAGE